MDFNLRVLIYPEYYNQHLESSLIFEFEHSMNPQTSFRQYCDLLMAHLAKLVTQSPELEISCVLDDQYNGLDSDSPVDTLCSGDILRVFVKTEDSAVSKIPAISCFEISD
ncbi:hypothetical protein JCM33374_g5171 [Metschnikowia sp. JCM 33374]|nr:hypothetical protein JCM33374_g5171 [Metschnikowia sp. JCM 33374]